MNRIAEITARWSDDPVLYTTVDYHNSRNDVLCLLSHIDQLQAELNDMTDIARQNEAKFLRQKEIADAAVSEVDQLKEAIKIKGGTEHAPTEDAYMAVCKALEKIRAERDAAIEKCKTCAGLGYMIAHGHGMEGK